MKRSAPLKRTPFKAKPKAHVPRERAPQPAYTLQRVGVHARVSDTAAPVPKAEIQRNRRLLDMARGRPCLFSLPGICNRDPATTVAAHSNWGEHGKGAGLKASDAYSCWGCFACHAWLDQGAAPAAEKRAAFDAAHRAQVEAWRRVAADPAEKEADRAAAAWALDRVAA